MVSSWALGAIKSDDHKCILNDCGAIDATIKKYGEHGVLIALCDVEYNDVNRTFQKWHSKLKGGLSAYEKKNGELARQCPDIGRPRLYWPR